jgi:MoxR-like ATPase
MIEIQPFAEKVIANVEKVIIGKHNAVGLTLIGLLCQGHLLIEDVPGVGKTMLARSLAASLGCSMSRIQFTPDMLPSDVTGVSIFNQSNREFEFRLGPIFSQIVLADEINRATPKTQAALLEAMQEQQVTVDGITHPLDKPFMVLATQNPIEYEGTFPLPEAQLDRFLLRIRLGYPSREDEIRVLESQTLSHPVDALKAVSSAQEVLSNQSEVKKIFVSDAIKQYIVALTEQTRTQSDVYLGASPRGSLALFRTSQALAAIQGRDFVLPDDVKSLVPSCLGHRLILGPSARLQELSTDTVLDEVMEKVPVPGADLIYSQN